MTQCQAAQLADVSLEDLHRETLLALHAASHPPQAGGDTNETQLQRPPIAPLLASLADKCAELRRREIVTQAVPG
ncbi:MAG TPA: hypothetical protein VHM19_09270, partial [Polyangiales bacterium]|nr:hypothetical protein [Polyangiales bacterium]